MFSKLLTPRIRLMVNPLTFLFPKIKLREGHERVTREQILQNRNVPSKTRHHMSPAPASHSSTCAMLTGYVLCLRGMYIVLKIFRSKTKIEAKFCWCLLTTGCVSVSNGQNSLSVMKVFLSMLPKLI